MSRSNLTPHFYAAHEIDGASISSLIEELTWAYVENPTTIELLAASDQLPHQYSYGRAFGSAYEVRWQRTQSGQYEVQVLYENTSLGLDERFQEIVHFDEIDAMPQATLLWGVKAEKTVNGAPVWIETRIPRLLSYPTQPVENVYLWGYGYKIDGRVTTSRWVHLGGTFTNGSSNNTHIFESE